MIERTATVPQSPESVFAVVSDPATHPRWRPTVKEFRLADDGGLRVGAPLTELVRYLGREYRSELEVTELDAPSALALKTTKAPIPFTLAIRLEPAGSGTRIRFQCDAPDASAVARFLLGHEMGKELRGLVRLLAG
jgi:uncharacterized protein YndB with AHSA1/START domain